MATLVLARSSMASPSVSETDSRGQARIAPSGDDGRLLETVGRHMVLRPMVGGIDESVATVLDRMREADLGYAGTIYVLDAREQLAGQVPLTTLLGSMPGLRLRELMIDVPTHVTPELDQEHAASGRAAHARPASVSREGCAHAGKEAGKRQAKLESRRTIVWTPWNVWLAHMTHGPIWQGERTCDGGPDGCGRAADRRAASRNMEASPVQRLPP